MTVEADQTIRADRDLPESRDPGPKAAARWSDRGGGASLVCLIGFGIATADGGLSRSAWRQRWCVLYGLGQLVMVQFANAGARTLLTVSLCSYTTRVVVLGLVLVLYERNRESWPSLVPMAIFVTVMAAVAGWLAVEIFVFSRLRIGAYDTEYTAPAGGVSEP